MAEVVGLVASIATLIEVAGKTGRTISRIRKLQASPPRYVLAAQNEIEHFTAALDLIQDILSNGIAAPPDKATAELARLHKQAMTALQELDAFLKEEVIFDQANSSSTFKLRRRAKAKEIFGEAQPEFLDFQQQLMSIKQNMQLVLQALQFQAPLRASLQLQRISVVQSGTTTTVDAGNRNVTATCLEKAVVSSTTKLAALRSPDASSIRSESLVKTDDRVIFELQRAPKGCRSQCPCQCHIALSGSTPRWLQGLMGTMFFSLSGVPLINRRACNFKGCSAKGAANGKAYFQYVMPTWALPYAIGTAATWNTLGGLGGTWSLRIPRFMNDHTLYQRFGWLCRRGTVEDFQKLMSRSGMRAIDLFSQSSNEDSGLFALAVRSSRSEICKMLIENGADISYRDACGISMIGLFWMQQHAYEVFDELIDHPEIAEAYETLNLTPGHDLVTANAFDDLAVHLNNFPAAITLRDDSGLTLLHWAAACGAVEALNVLIKAGADVNTVCKRGRTPLMWACMTLYSFELCTALVRGGADVNKIDQRGDNALMRLILTHCVDGKPVRLLLDAGIDVHHVSNGGQTALMIAASNVFAGSFEACSLLLEHGALVNQIDTWGWTPATQAIAENNHSVLELFIKHGASLDTIMKANGLTIIHLAAARSDVRTMRQLRDAHIHGLPMDEKTIKHYWRTFEARERYFFGLREPIEVERNAFQELLDSIVPLDWSLAVSQPEPDRIVPGAFPMNEDRKENYAVFCSEQVVDTNNDANQRISGRQVLANDDLDSKE
ncbi:b-cell lymphoma 3-encoded protein [Stagonosporopsis vannaccii]|nr:b-cell lymphoma 3-encoded protein [Stagonosporopsis vannaccii]